MDLVPLKPLPNQSVTVSLGGQSCRLRVYQRSTGLFIDVSVSDTLIIGGVICENLRKIVRDSYLGFVGDLCFIDNQGSDDPDFTGLGGRWSLAYLTVDDVASAA